MLEYHAAYFKDEGGWYFVKVLDFPRVLSQGQTLRSAQRMIRDALRMMAEALVEEGKALLRPDPSAKSKKAGVEETIPLRICANCGGGA